MHKHLRVLPLGPPQAQGIHPPAVTDGVKEPAATGGARVAARHVGGAVFHQAAAAACWSYEVGPVFLKQYHR